MRTMRFMLGGVLAAVLIPAGTEPARSAEALLRASANVTFGALHSERAVKATIVSLTPVTVSVRCARRPANVFLGDERLAANAWQFDTAAGVASVALPAGTTALQLRFDELTDLKPFQARIPVLMVGDGGSAGREVGAMTLTVAAEKVSGTWAWVGPEGLYQWRAVKAGAEAAGVHVATAAPGGPEGVLLQAGALLTLQGDAPGQTVPVERLECRLVAAVTPTRRIAKDSLLWARSIVLEGEGFTAEGGGTVSRSTEHGNTHGGGCIYAWGTPGHWIAWEAAIPATEDYILSLVLASQETVVLRSFSLDGQPATNAAVMRIEGTGGWGRANAEEWQAVQPVDDQGRPVRLRLSAGTHELRLSNLLGQHLNIDCLLLTPAQ